MAFVKTLMQQTKKILYFTIFSPYTSYIRKNFPMPPKFRKFLHNIWCKLFSALGIDWNLVHMIFIETITACNLRCSYCPNSIYDRGLIKNMKKMKAKLFYKIIDELAEIGWMGLMQPHSYGEPLLDDRLIGFIKYAKNKIQGLRINLHTNGELLNINLYKKLVKAGVDMFTVTQHLPTPAKGVLEVLDYRKKFGSNGTNFFYSKRTYIMNRGGLVKIKNGQKKTECAWPYYNAGIDYAGNVLVCCNEYLNEAKVGNVNNEKLINIWNKPRYKKIRKDMLKGRFTLAMCKKCKTSKVV